VLVGRILANFLKDFGKRRRPVTSWLMWLTVFRGEKTEKSKLNTCWCLKNEALDFFITIAA